jgi:predicted small lipoprotein YifL
MRTAVILASVVPTVLAGCGVKSNLEKPPGPVLQMEQKDPSRPPVILGEPTRVIPPYPTGP